MGIVLLDGKQLASRLPDEPWAKHVAIAIVIVCYALRLTWEAMVVLAVLKILGVI